MNKKVLKFLCWVPVVGLILAPYLHWTRDEDWDEFPIGKMPVLHGLYIGCVSLLIPMAMILFLV